MRLPEISKIFQATRSALDQCLNGRGPFLIVQKQVLMAFLDQITADTRALGASPPEWSLSKVIGLRKLLFCHEVHLLLRNLKVQENVMCDFMGLCPDKLGVRIPEKMFPAEIVLDTDWSVRLTNSAKLITILQSEDQWKHKKQDANHF